MFIVTGHRAPQGLTEAARAGAKTRFWVHFLHHQKGLFYRDRLGTIYIGKALDKERYYRLSRATSVAREWWAMRMVRKRVFCAISYYK
jgi:hypothetical protein